MTIVKYYRSRKMGVQYFECRSLKLIKMEELLYNFNFHDDVDWFANFFMVNNIVFVAS
jgi:hypothetical protein